MLNSDEVFSHKRGIFRFNKAAEKGQGFLNIGIHWQNDGKVLIPRPQTEINEQIKPRMAKGLCYTCSRLRSGWAWSF